MTSRGLAVRLLRRRYFILKVVFFYLFVFVLFLNSRQSLVVFVSLF